MNRRPGGLRTALGGWRYCGRSSKGGPPRDGNHSHTSEAHSLGDLNPIVMVSLASLQTANVVLVMLASVKVGQDAYSGGGYGMSRSFGVAIALSVLPYAVHAQSTARASALHDTLPRFAAVTPAARDSASLVAAADDALQGKFGITAPMIVTRFQRGRSGAEISMKPDTTHGISWKDLGGTVRILSDGRRVILRRF